MLASLLLPVRCARHLSLVHKDCAERWFCIRRRFTCEICGATATGLPEDIRAAIRQAALFHHQLRSTRFSLSGIFGSAEYAGLELELSASGANAVDYGDGGGGREAGWGLGMPLWLTESVPDRGAQLYILFYTIFCLVPTCLVAAALVVYYNSE
jgi:hypothetical protein